MKSFYLALALNFLLFNTAFSQTEGKKSLNVTVYDDYLGVVRETRTLDIKQGVSEVKITDIPQLINPNTVKLQFNGTILEQNYQYDLVSLDKILYKYIDKEIELVGESTIKGTLMSATNESVVLKKPEGGLVMIPAMKDYRVSVGSLPEGLITKPTLIWTLDAAKAGKQDVEFSYQTAGMNWFTGYVAQLNENDTKMDLNAWVNIENRSGSDYEKANLKLVAGNVNKIKKSYYRYEKSVEDYAGDPLSASGREPQFLEKSFFEYHVYDLQRQTTLKNNETKQISLFEAKNVNVTKKFVYKTGKKANKNKVNVVVEFDNKKDNQMGMPMPAGIVRLNKSDGESIEFIGEDQIGHTPKDETVSLKVGDAFDIVAETSEMEHTLIGESTDEVKYEIKLKNRKTENVEIEVEANFGDNWIIIDPNFKYVKKNATTAVFKVPVAKDQEIVLKYKVRFSY